jgi:hypothetical protein
MAVLAGMEFLVFAAALCLISLPYFDGESLAHGSSGPLVDRPLSAPAAAPPASCRSRLMPT